jgi:hypothetical protein
MRGTAGVLPAQHPEPVGSLNTPGDPTAREHQVLELIAQDLDNSTIGLRLGMHRPQSRLGDLQRTRGEKRAQAIVRA